MNETYTHTVITFLPNGKKQRTNCVSHQQAIDFANNQLRQRYKCKIYPYKPRRSYVDILAERGPNG